MIYWSLLFLSLLGAHLSSAQITFPKEKSKSAVVDAKDTKADAVAIEPSSSDPSKPSSDPQARFLPFLGGGSPGFGRPGQGPVGFGQQGQFSGQGPFLSQRPGSFGRPGQFFGGNQGLLGGQGGFGVGFPPGRPGGFGGGFPPGRPGGFGGGFPPGRPGGFGGGFPTGRPGGFGGGFPTGRPGGFGGGFPPGGLGSFGQGPFHGGPGLSAQPTKLGICPRPSVIKDFLGIRSLPGADDAKASSDPKKRTKRQGTHDAGSSPKSNNPQTRIFGGPLGGLFCDDECISDFQCPGHFKCCFKSNNCRHCATPEFF